ncbi:hypothetical protein KIL84_020975 [Mauremys mutica]|uniref:Uncharacterized protein n=1 Tax=Mauremys mutica TaxID=74926 RepID=A0A9D3XAN4_9SAUR|nr:hypothetical protein KIL84_020975 [Mauremys mutica]
MTPSGQSQLRRRDESLLRESFPALSLSPMMEFKGKLNFSCPSEKLRLFPPFYPLYLVKGDSQPPTPPCCGEGSRNQQWHAALPRPLLCQNISITDHQHSCGTSIWLLRRVGLSFCRAPRNPGFLKATSLTVSHVWNWVSWVGLTLNAWKW